MGFLTTFLLWDVVVFICTIFLAWYVWFLLVSRNHWKKRGIPYKPPYFFFGNTFRANFFVNTGELLDEIYTENKKHKIFGIWFYTKPTLLVFDVPTIKNMLVKDFQYFHDRGIPVDENVDPLNGHLFNLSGTKWRNLRVKLTPTFTSGKMKMMFSTMLDVAEQMESFLDEPANKKEVIEIKDILARFTTDIIASCAFGIETNSLQNPNSEFRVYGNKIFHPTFKTFVIQLGVFLFPNLEKMIKLKRTPQNVEDFFMKVFRDTVGYREANNVKRKDFLDLLIQIKNKGYVEDADTKYSVNGEDEAKETGDAFTMEEAAAQAFVFFLAGFETSSTAMTWAIYELAKNPEVQRKFQKEIDIVLSKNNNEITYDAIQDMEYLDCVLNESMRMYSPVGILFRECTKDYKIPDMDITLEKGTGVMIPMSSIQMDPEYFPEPKVFRPERFSAAEKAKRDHFLHLPFGEGPRICIGNRFGLLQSKVGLFKIFSKYNIEVAKETPIPVKLDPKSFIPTPIHGMPLRITKRQL